MFVPTRFTIAPLLLALCAPLALAQDTDSKPAEQISTTATTSGGGFGGGGDAKEINFPGGTFAEYATLIRKLFPDVSIVLAPGVADFEVPAMQAKVKRPEYALSLVCGIDGDLVYPNGTYGGVLDSQYIAGDLFRVVGVKKTTSRNLPAQPKAAITTQVSPMIALLDSGLTIEEILGTLKVAFELQESSPPVLRYHEATGILFIRGTYDQQNIFDETYEALEVIAADRKRITSVKAEYKSLQEKYTKLLGQYADLEAKLKQHAHSDTHGSDHE